MGDYADLLRKYLRHELPEWMPEEVVDRTVEAFDKGDKMNKADYKTAPLIAKGLAQYVKEQYNPSQPRGRRINEPETYAAGMWATTKGDGQGAYLMTSLADAAKGTRFAHNTDAYWPANANIRYGNKYPGVDGYVEPEEPSTANVRPGFERDTPAHEFAHTDPGGLNPANEFVSDTVPVGYERGLSAEKNEQARDALLNFSLLSTFVDEEKLPANALDSSEELMAALVGRESSIPAGKSVQDDEVLGTVLKVPALRDWYLKNRGIK